MNTPRLVSLGTSCISGVQIKFIKKQTGLVSPFNWALTKIDDVLMSIKDDFTTLLDRDKYTRKDIFNLEGKSESAVISAAGATFIHSNPIDDDNDYDKLTAQCSYMKECLSQPRDIGYMVTVFYNYKSNRETLISIRKIIPKDCKFLVCQVHIGKNSEPELNDDNIYVASLDIGDYTKRSAGRKRPGLLCKGERARGYGISPEYTKIVDTVFS